MTKIRQGNQYLLVLSFSTSLIGLILTIIGYSKVSVTLTVNDIFDPITGNNYSLDRIMETIKKNFNYSEGNYYMICAGLANGLTCASIMALILAHLFENKRFEEQKDRFMIVNPLRPTQAV